MNCGYDKEGRTGVRPFSALSLQPVIPPAPQPVIPSDPNPSSRTYVRDLPAFAFCPLPRDSSAPPCSAFGMTERGTISKDILPRKASAAFAGKEQLNIVLTRRKEE